MEGAEDGEKEEIEEQDGVNDEWIDEEQQGPSAREQNDGQKQQRLVRPCRKCYQSCGKCQRTSVDEACEQCVKDNRRCSNNLDGAVTYRWLPSRSELHRRPVRKCRICLQVGYLCERTSSNEPCKRCINEHKKCRNDLDGIRFREDQK